MCSLSIACAWEQVMELCLTRSLGEALGRRDGALGGYGEMAFVKSTVEQA